MVLLAAPNTPSAFHFSGGTGGVFMFPSPNGIFQTNNVLLQLNLKPAQVNHEPLWRLFNYSIIIHYSGYKRFYSPKV